MSQEKTQVLILGGGFGGVYTAMYLEKGMTAAERQQIEVTLVSQENYIVFQPFLPEVISGTIETLHVITPIRRLAKRSRLHTREIESIDIEKKEVVLSPEFIPRKTTLKYDHLVLGLGMQMNYSLVPGMKEHAFDFKYLGDALQLRNEVVRMLERADNETNPEERKKLLTFVVGGGGFSGVECVAELNDFLRNSLPAYKNTHMEDVRVVLLQSAGRILPEVDATLAEYAQKILGKRGIEIFLNTRLIAVTADGAQIQDKATKEKTFIPSRVVVSTVPAAPHDMITALPCEKERGKVTVTKYMDVPNWPGLWALGDCAFVPQRDGINSPPTAQHALRQAKTCATNILATIRGKERKPFMFTGLGKLASLGQRSAVAEVFGIKISGMLAWLMWRGIYLSKFPGLDRKFRIAVDWLLDIFLPRDITQVRIFKKDPVTQEHFQPGQMVFNSGDFGDKVYVVVSGEVEVVVEGGKVVATLGEGEVFGEIALISDKSRTAQIRAKTPLDVISVSRQAFKTLVKHLPGVKTSMEDVMRSHGHEVDLEKELTGSEDEAAEPEPKPS